MFFFILQLWSIVFLGIEVWTGICSLSEVVEHQSRFFCFFSFFLSPPKVQCYCNVSLSSALFNILSFFCTFHYFMFKGFLFWFCLCSVLHTLDILKTSLRLGKFSSAIFLKSFSVPLICFFFPSPSSIPIIHRFGIFTVYQIFWIYLDFSDSTFSLAELLISLTRSPGPELLLPLYLICWWDIPLSLMFYFLSFSSRVSF